MKVYFVISGVALPKLISILEAVETVAVRLLSPKGYTTVMAVGFEEVEKPSLDIIANDYPGNLDRVIEEIKTKLPDLEIFVDPD